MKQRITIEQINELNDDQKQKLREWWEPSVGDSFINQRGMNLFVSEIVEHVNGLQIRFVSVPITYPYQSHDEDGYSLIHKSRCLPLLSTGQMTEFFSSKERTERMRDISSDIEIWEPGEMCDRLWEEVKKVLQ